ncbi:MAG: ACP S-malonyltransferase [Acidobacteriota bacterium]|nr:ACP S-malonyltransferase [Acidobacteriota bacterium]
MGSVEDNNSPIGNRQSAIGNRKAFLFPGQGSQYPGMGKDLADHFPAARQVFEEADDALGFPISDLCFAGPAEALQLTENTQPAILSVSIAAWRALESLGVEKPDYVAGHSLGEYSALVAAGAISLADAVRTVRARGRYMQEAVPAGEGAMAAVLGASLETIEEVCAAVRGEQVCAPANINSANQIVIAGNTEAVDRAAEKLKDAGAKRVVKLNVSAPFHCALMMPAQLRLATDLAELSLDELSVPLISNVDAIAITRAVDARGSLIRQVSSPVRWLQSMNFLLEAGVNSFVELGPGKVLSGLLRQINREAKCLSVEESAGVAAAGAGLAVS